MIIDTSTLSHIPSIESQQRLTNLRKYCFPSTPSSNSDAPGVNTEVRPGEKRGPARLRLLRQKRTDTHRGPDRERTRFGACRKENNPHPLPAPLVLTSHLPPGESAAFRNVPGPPERAAGNGDTKARIHGPATCLRGASVV